MVLRMDNGPEMISKRCNSSAEGKVGLSYILRAHPWNNGFIESFNNRLRKECLNRNYWTNLLRSPRRHADFKHEHNTAHRHSALALTPAEYAAQCSHTITPWPARSTEIGTTTWPLNQVGLTIGDRSVRDATVDLVGRIHYTEVADHLCRRRSAPYRDAGEFAAPPMRTHP